MPEGKDFDYLRPKRAITYSIDSTYNISLIEINFHGWFESCVCLWPKNNKMKSNFLLLERTEHHSLHQAFLLFHHLMLELTLYFSL